MGWVKARVRFKGNFCHNFSGGDKGQVQTFTDRKQLIDRLIESKDYEKSIFLTQNVSQKRTSHSKCSNNPGLLWSILALFDSNNFTEKLYTSTGFKLGPLE